MRLRLKVPEVLQPLFFAKMIRLSLVVDGLKDSVRSIAEDMAGTQVAVKLEFHLFDAADHAW